LLLHWLSLGSDEEGFSSFHRLTRERLPNVEPSLQGFNRSIYGAPLPLRITPRCQTSSAAPITRTITIPAIVKRSTLLFIIMGFWGEASGDASSGREIGGTALKY